MSNQTMLVAVGLHGRGCLMGFKGDMVFEFWSNRTSPTQWVPYDAADLFDDLPIKPGLYVWEGEIVWTPYENGNESYPEAVSGSFRPARLDEQESMTSWVRLTPMPREDEDRDPPGT